MKQKYEICDEEKNAPTPSKERKKSIAPPTHATCTRASVCVLMINHKTTGTPLAAVALDERLFRLQVTFAYHSFFGRYHAILQDAPATFQPSITVSHFARIEPKFR